jgi:hypothetical protein
MAGALIIAAVVLFDRATALNEKPLTPNSYRSTPVPADVSAKGLSSTTDC